MSASEHPPYFSPEGYRGILHRALALGYRFTTFREFMPPFDRPALLLRHDLDHSLRSAAALAEWERELGTPATYFVQVACVFYNLLAPESREIVRRLTTLGHEVGLHYDAQRYQGDGGMEQLRRDVRLLSELAEQPVESASQHIPIDSGAVDVRQVVRHEAYDQRFTTDGMTYISDSLMHWRQATPHDLLTQRASFQLLTHPMKWVRSFGNMEEAIDFAHEQEIAALRTADTDVRLRYSYLLRERARLDQEFRARRAPSGGS